MTHSIFFAVAAREQRSSRVAEKTTYVLFFKVIIGEGSMGGGFCLLGIYIFFVVFFIFPFFFCFCADK